MSKEELFDVLDENGIFTGEILPRSEIHKKGLWHRAIAVAIVNAKNQILLQQRSSHKDKNAGLWDISVAGHLTTGQDSLSAAAREINEEVSVMLGYKTEIKDFRYMYSYRKIQDFSGGGIDFIERQFYDLFILRIDELDDTNIAFQESEVQAVKFTDFIDIQKMIDNKTMVDRPEVYEVLSKYLFRF